MALKSALVPRGRAHLVKDDHQKYYAYKNATPCYGTCKSMTDGHTCKSMANSHTCGSNTSGGMPLASVKNHCTNSSTFHLSPAGSTASVLSIMCSSPSCLWK